ncbi:MAG: GNAT family N-acetyltransferase [Rhodocyclaceae bacterium]
MDEQADSKRHGISAHFRREVLITIGSILAFLGLALLAGLIGPSVLNRFQRLIPYALCPFPAACWPRGAVSMSDDIEIRLMRATDIPAVVAIQATCYTEVAPESGGSLLAKRDASPETCFLALYKRVPVGYLIAVPWTAHDVPELDAERCRPPDTANCLYLHDLAVAPQARKSGVGLRLVDAFMDAFKRSGLKDAGLIAVQASAAYWSRFGFSSVALSGPPASKLATYGERVAYMMRPAGE